MDNTLLVTTVEMMTVHFNLSIDCCDLFAITLPPTQQTKKKDNRIIGINILKRSSFL